MKDGDRYTKCVFWSDEDECFIGSCPDVCGNCCHGDDPTEVFRELCEIVEEWVETLKQEGKPLPPVSSLAANSNKLALAA